MKKRFIFLNCFIILVLIISAAVVIFSAKAYTERIPVSAEGVKAEDVSFDTDHGIIRVADCHVEDNNLIFTVLPQDGKVGEDYLSILIDEGGEEPMQWLMSYYAGWFGTVFKMDSFNFKGWRVVTGLLYLVLLAILAVMLWSFIEKWRKAEYSYPMIVYGGFSVFLLSMLINTVFIGGGQPATFGEYLIDTANSGYEFVFFSVPVTVVFAVAVSVSNIFLMIREGFRPVNALGILFSLLMIGGRALIYSSTFYISGSEAYVRWMEILYLPMYTMLAYVECMLYATAISAYLASRHKPPYDRDFLVILGCAIRPDGSLTPLLRGRADSAVRFEKEQYEATGNHAVFVPSGGQGSDEVIAEGEAIRRYLSEQGIPDEQVLPETKSVNTRENMVFSKEIMDQHADGEYKAAFATTNYHVFRGYILSEKAALKGAQGISAKTKWYFFPNAFLREFVGLIFEEKKRHIFLVAVIILFYMALSLIAPM